MTAWPRIPLEDTFGDVLRKAMRGNGVDTRALAERTGISPADIDAWRQDRGVADDAQARAIARILRLDPGKLADRAADAWYPPEIELPDVRHHPQNPHPSNGFIFFLDGGRRAALVDPAGIPANLLRAVREGPYHLQYILITHKHADHCDATAEVAAAFPQAQIVMHRLDVGAIGSLAHKALAVRDGEALPFGEGAEIRMLHTPGHTDGSVSYLFKSTVFTGDTLFAGSVGGIFADESTYDDLLHSVRTKLFTLPEATVIMPGHGPPSTIELERAHNPFF
ncbi:MAG TPA: MBL fold metallo-hydrolase [Candidatus Baltobacteraceae bacterium]|nr:MBL fold metallo-hydrolase [Candidatus Baltobacteraceae bacterium]